MERYFPSERAWWFGLITWILFPGIFVTMLVTEFLAPAPAGLILALTGTLPVLLVGGFTIWIWFSTG